MNLIKFLFQYLNFIPKAELWNFANLVRSFNLIKYSPYLLPLSHWWIDCGTINYGTWLWDIQSTLNLILPTGCQLINSLPWYMWCARIRNSKQCWLPTWQPFPLISCASLHRHKAERGSNTVHLSPSPSYWTLLHSLPFRSDWFRGWHVLAIQIWPMSLRGGLTLEQLIFLIKNFLAVLDVAMCGCDVQHWCINP